MALWFRIVAIAAALTLSWVGEAQAKWLRAETAHFNLYSNGREAELRDFATKLEVFDEALRYFHPAPVDAHLTKLDIYLVNDEDELDRIWRRSSGVAGFYSADSEGTFAVARRDGGDFAQTVLFHEYTHHFMLRNYSYPYPRWLVEGWAEYFGSSRVYPDRIDVGLPNGERGESIGSWSVSTRDLFSKRSSELPNGSVYVFYARAWLLTHYLMSDDNRRRELNSYMRLVGEGGDTIASLEKALGYDMVTLDRKLREYLSHRVPYTSIKRKNVTIPMTVTALSPAADDILLEHVRLVSGVSSKDAQGALKNIQFRAKRHPDDRLARLTLARAYIMLGDPADAEPILQHYVADQKDTEALYLMGLRYARMAEKELGYDQRKAEAEQKAEKLKGQEDKDPPLPEINPDPLTRARAVAWYAKARPWFVKANHADPESYEVLFAFAQSRAFDADYPTDGTMETLASAYQLAPQVGTITYTSAKALIARGRQPEAINLLRLLANDPHGGSLAKSAKALLESLNAATPEEGS